MTDRKADTKCFYELMDRLEQRVGGPHLLKDFMSVVAPTEKGVYFIFEPEEYRIDSREKLRVVRVGTHGLIADSRSTIWTRLFEHLMANGRSVFRSQVNQALKCAGHDEGSTGRDHSERITRRIGSMRFLWVRVNGDNDHTERKYIETNTIKLLSARNSNATHQPSPNWLGKHSNKSEVRCSGLWNVQHTKPGDYNSEFLNDLENCIRVTEASDWSER
ncbi:MAG: hypothetical protein F4X40_02460 [Chloroflexi bacterium]|nr:hypothetical protein [Chloroflexota bacterium]